MTRVFLSCLMKMHKVLSFMSAIGRTVACRKRRLSFFAGWGKIPGKRQQHCDWALQWSLLRKKLFCAMNTEGPHLAGKKMSEHEKTHHRFDVHLRV